MTLPCEVWRLAQQVLRWVFVTLPREVWRLAQQVLRWMFVTLPREVWRLAPQVLRWAFVTLPRVVWRLAQQVLRWVFVTLPREVWLAVRFFARQLTRFVREQICALLTALKSLWDLLGKVVPYVVATLITPATVLWLIYRRVVDDGTRSETVPRWDSPER